jgi:hypothetical protein
LMGIFCFVALEKILVKTGGRAWPSLLRQFGLWVRSCGKAFINDEGFCFDIFCKDFC